MKTEVAENNQHHDSNQAEQPDDLVKSVSSKELSQLHKLVFLLSLNILNFHRAIMSSRRSNQHRLRRRRIMMRGYYIRQMLEIQTSYFLMMPALLRLCISSNKKNNELRQMEDIGYRKKNDTLPPRFYEDIVCSFSATQWLATFRVPRETFQWLCVQLKDPLKANHLSISQKNIISLEKRVAISLYTFANGVDYSEVAERFGVSRTSVCKFIKRFSDVITNVLGSHLLALPTTLEEFDEIRYNFQTASNMPPLVVGILGQFELPVNPISEGLAINQNGRGEQTLILQAMVDDKLLIRKIIVEPQSLSVFLEDILKLPQQKINGRQLPCFVVAPSSYYPLRPWLLHQYDLPINPHQHDFNDSMEQLLEFKNKAFRRLFGRWHILHRNLDLESKTMKNIAAACCVLHNLLEEANDVYMEEWESNLDMAKFTNVRFDGNAPRDIRSAAEMRDFLARTISSTEI